jgi:hypothetical protein
MRLRCREGRMRRLAIVLSTLLPVWTACLSGCPIGIDTPTAGHDNDGRMGGGGGGGGAY